MKLEKPDKYLKEIKQLYENAFPENERNDFNFLITDRFPNFKLFAITKDNLFVGFTFVTFFKEIAYVVYLAIEEEFRSCGYGSLALEILKDKVKGYNIMLSVERPVTENQKRRLSFYQKNKFFVTGFELISRDVEFQVLCFGKYNKEQLVGFFKLCFPDAILL